MRKYKIDINGLYTFAVFGKSTKEVEENYFPSIRNYYLTNNLPLINLWAGITNSDARLPLTVEQVINILKRQTQ